MIASTETRAPDLVSEVLALKPGDHLCLIYDEDPSEQMLALLPYLSQGLQNGERCVYIADHQLRAELRGALADYGIDVDGECDRGALELRTQDEWRDAGALGSALEAARVRRMIDEALSDGFAGIRFAVEMTWTLSPDIEANRLRQWEATIKRIFTPEKQARIICQYSRKALSEATIEAALANHPVAIVGCEVLPNPYYEAPRILDAAPAPGAPSMPPEWLMSQLGWARALEHERAERQRAEEALARVEQERERVEGMYRIAENAAEALRKAHAINEEFLGLVSHELRAPISTVIGNGLLLLNRGDVLQPDDRLLAMRDLVDDARRLGRIVDNLLILTRAQVKPPQREPLSLQHVIEDAARALRERDSCTPLVTHFDADVPPADAEPALISLVLENILSNAVRYSPAGSEIEVSLRANDRGQPEVCVRDHGIGFDEKALQNLFTPFFRAEAARSKAGGMGISLAVCRRVIEAHGGKIRGANHPEGGAAVSFSLEAAPED